MPNSANSPENSSPCPAWCVRAHSAADHPDDRYHRGPVSAVPGVSGEGDPIEIVIYAASDDTSDPPRLVMEESERPRRLTLSWPTASDVLAAARETVGFVNETDYSQSKGTNE